MDFEWHIFKEIINIKKHRISFGEAVESFKDINGFVLEDKKHSQNELRYYWIGKTIEGKIITSRFVIRNIK